jgi:hypothetical protein
VKLRSVLDWILVVTSGAAASAAPPQRLDLGLASKAARTASASASSMPRVVIGRFRALFLRLVAGGRRLSRFSCFSNPPTSCTDRQVDRAAAFRAFQAAVSSLRRMRTSLRGSRFVSAIRWMNARLISVVRSLFAAATGPAGLPAASSLATTVAKRIARDAIKKPEKAGRRKRLRICDMTSDAAGIFLVLTLRPERLHYKG